MESQGNSTPRGQTRNTEITQQTKSWALKGGAPRGEPKPRKGGAPEGVGAPEGWGPRKGGAQKGGAPKGGAPKGGAPKGGSPNLEKVSPGRVGPRRVGPGRVGPRRVGGPKFRAFFSFSHPHFHSFFLSLGIFSCLFFSLRVSSRVFVPLSGGLLVECWWCFWLVGSSNVLVFRPQVVVWKPPVACRPPGEE